MGRKVIKVSDNTAIVIEPFQNQYGDYIGVREFYKPKDDLEGDWRPTQKGLSIPVDKGVKVRKAIKWALENFEEEHKKLESTKGPKRKSKDDDDEDEKPKKKDKKKAKKRRDEDDDE
jgi:hypothetical protein